MSRLIRPQSPLFTLVLAALVGLPALAIDMSLPALSAITDGLHVAPGKGSLTLSALLIGFGALQLVFGPLSDRFGRRPVLAGGLALFTLAGLACTLATSFPFLLAARLLQGAGAAAGTVLAIAMVRDCFDGPAARTRLGYVNAVMNVAPVAAPVIGAGVLAVAGWREIFAVLAVVGALTWAVSVFVVPETIRQRNPLATRPADLLRSYGRAMRHRNSFGHTLAGGLLFGNMFAFISGSPLVYIDQLGLSAGAFSAIFAVTSAGLVAGSLTAGRLGRGRWGTRLLPVGLGVMLLASAGLLLLATPAITNPGRFSVSASVPLLLVDYLACGLALPGAMHGAIEPFPDMAGVASAVNGSVRMAGGALAGALLTALYDGTPWAMTSVMSLSAGGGLLLWALMLRGGRRVASIRASST